jgi:hypothetical protein
MRALQLSCSRFECAETVPLPATASYRLRNGSSRHPNYRPARPPPFESMNPAHPSYARLHTSGPEEIYRGAENRTEMGVFASLEAPLREDFLRGNLDDFLRAGLVAGLQYEMPSSTP